MQQESIARLPAACNVDSGSLASRVPPMRRRAKHIDEDVEGTCRRDVILCQKINVEIQAVTLALIRTYHDS